MKKSLFTEEQIVFALKQAELGTPVRGAVLTLFLGWKDSALIKPSRCSLCSIARYANMLPMRVPVVT
ncbi:hypothetical protein ACQYRI_20720 [Salmonella enterica]